jgi:hypothetical protein
VVPFLLWDAATPAWPAPARVADRVAALLGEFFALPVRPSAAAHPLCHLVWAELPVEGWQAPVEAREGLERSFAFEYPVNLPEIAPSLGALARRLAVDDGRELARVTPPMTLLHLAPDRAWLVNDGLGAAQLFLHRGPRGWAVTNRLVLLEALEVPLRPEPEDWALRLSLPYFPDARTGFAGVAYVPPGTRGCIGAAGLALERLDALGRWLTGPPAPLDQALEAVDGAVRAYVDHAAQLSPVLACGLSGGHDSRAVVAAVRASGHPFRLRTKGGADSEDVQVARRLAALAGLPLRVKPDGEAAPDPADAADVGRAIRLALRWQGGAMVVHKHKTLFARGARFTGGAANVMGQYGEVLRARLPRLLGGRVPAEGEAEPRVYARLVDALLARAPAFWRPEVAAAVRAETARLARAVPDGIPGLAERLEAFYIVQDVRRWTTGTLGAQFAAPLTPLLTPAALWAAVHSPAEARLRDAFHRHLIERHAPEWQDVPLATHARRGDSRYFDNRRFWTTFGWRGLRALSPDGLDFVGALCDPAALEARWLEHPDEAALLLALPGAFRSG